MEYITEPAKRLPVKYTADVCVVGGSATGVFAAVRAARLGAKVILMEQNGFLGGVATAALVCCWHSNNDMTGKNQIIAGLTAEVEERLRRIGAGDLAPNGNEGTARASFHFNPYELRTELDVLCRECGVQVLLHTYYCAQTVQDGKITHVIAENKDGRFAVAADFFIDATGDGDLARDTHLPCYRHAWTQPPTPTYLVAGLQEHAPVSELIKNYPNETTLSQDSGWGVKIPGSPNVILQADTHILGVDCATAEGLSRAEEIGRAQIRECMKLIRAHVNPDAALAATHAYLGLRETVHYQTKKQAVLTELMLGTAYDDCVMQGTYCGDEHLSNGAIHLKYFDGTCATIMPDRSLVRGNWWQEFGVPADHEVPTRYRLPFANLVNEVSPNFIAVGRMIHADEGSFSALRVMVNLNQLGEAAGVAAYLSLHRNLSVQKLDGTEVARLLTKGGSANLS